MFHTVTNCSAVSLNWLENVLLLMFYSAVNTCTVYIVLLLCCVFAGIHPAGWTEEAAAGPRCVFLHTHKGGNTHINTGIIIYCDICSITWNILLFSTSFLLLSSQYGWRASRSSSPQIFVSVRTLLRLYSPSSASSSSSRPTHRYLLTFHLWPGV